MQLIAGEVITHRTAILETTLFIVTALRYSAAQNRLNDNWIN